MDAYAVTHDELDLEIRWQDRGGAGQAPMGWLEIRRPDAPEPAIVDQADLEWEVGDDANLAVGTGIRWKLLISGEWTETRGLAAGIAEVAPGAELMRHHHEPAEIYFIISGRGEMEIEHRWQPVGPGCAVYIPPDAWHALRCTGPEPLVLVFAFPRDRFDEIAYHFDR